MAGAFATWQPLYAEAGIATFPLNAVTKIPAVKNALQAGRPASRQWVEKYPDSPAFGFACGKYSKLSVLDIDTPDENFLADLLDRFGSSPIIAKTPSGGFHAWYKHNGEGRKIRPEKDKPFDILGGGVAIAPPSFAGAGQYKFIQGSLNDIVLLKPMHLPLVANAPDMGVPDVLAASGERNATLWRSLMVQARSADSLETLLSQAHKINTASFAPPLPDDEVIRTATSAWDYQQKGSNWIGSGKKVVSTFDEIDGLLAVNPDAFILLTVLRRHNWGQNFYAANEMAKIMPGGGWTRKRLSAARSALVHFGVIECLLYPSKENGAAVYRFTSSMLVAGEKGRGV
jgi:hypothetical protein